MSASAHARRHWLCDCSHVWHCSHCTWLSTHALHCVQLLMWIIQNPTVYLITVQMHNGPKFSEPPFDVTIPPKYLPLHAGTSCNLHTACHLTDAGPHFSTYNTRSMPTAQA